MQFVEGLGPLWEKVKRNPGTASELFIHSYKPLTMADVKKLYIVEYSPQGSNNRIKEEDTVYSFEIFLQNCQGIHYHFKTSLIWFNVSILIKSSEINERSRMRKYSSDSVLLFE